jgi:hypothetical protein
MPIAHGPELDPDADAELADAELEVDPELDLGSEPVPGRSSGPARPMSWSSARTIDAVPASGSVGCAARWQMEPFSSTRTANTFVPPMSTPAVSMTRRV